MYYILPVALLFHRSTLSKKIYEFAMWTTTVQAICYIEGERGKQKMIERFFNREAIGKDLDYKVLRHTLNEMTDQLMDQLTSEQKSLLSALTDLYTQLESSAALTAFKDGFYTAALLGLDIVQSQNQRQL